MWKLRGMKTMYWEEVVIDNSGLTVIVLILLKLIFYHQILFCKILRNSVKMYYFNLIR